MPRNEESLTWSTVATNGTSISDIFAPRPVIDRTSNKRRKKPSMVCVYCGVHKITKDGCKTCHRCVMCGCICVVCDVCGEKTGRTCKYEHSQTVCRACCTCRKIPNKMVMKRELAPVVVEGGEVQNSRVYCNSLQRMIGFEPEIAEWNGLERWNGIQYSIVGDSSVSPSGKEMNVAPMNGDRLAGNILKLGKAMAKYDCKVNDTCGFHVHVDGADFSYWEIRKLLGLWTGIEGGVFEYLVDKKRQGNHYCKPLVGQQLRQRLYRVSAKAPVDCPHGKKEYDELCPRCMRSRIKAVVMSVWYPGNVSGTTNRLNDLKQQMREAHGLRNRKYNGDRYYALNLCSWFHRGTFEFRLKEGLTDPEEMLGWVLFCGWVVEGAQRITDKEIQGINSLRQFVEYKIKNPFDRKTNYLLPEFVREWCLERMARS